MRPYTSLAELPAELYEAILDQIHPSELQKSTLALYLAVPMASVPLHHLYRHVLITARSQIPRLWRKLESSRKRVSERAVAHWVKSFCLDTFDADADILCNTIQLIPRIKFLHLNIGTTFGPEHLDDIFKGPQAHLSYLSLRFRPYVEKATYYQFLKGQYSDIVVDHMAKWPSNPSLTYLSIVQDPLPGSSLDPRLSFAQPIVFFSLEVFRAFSLSALAQSITHLRIRVPSRPVLAQLLEPGAFPSLKVLDISTSSLGNPERSLPLLLARHSNLEHLLLDSCPLSRERWRDLARACALAGQGKSRAREKKVNAWLERSSLQRVDTSGHDATTAEADSLVSLNLSQARPARRGRRGIATAAFSVRATPDPRLVLSEPSSNARNGNDVSTNSRRTKVRILPTLPSLLTLSTTFTPPPDAEKANDWRAEFEAGWRSGVETLLAARKRLWAHALAGAAGVRIMRFDYTSRPETSHGSDIEESFHDLMDVGLDETSIWEAECGIPVVCFGDVHSGGGVSINDRRPGSVNEAHLDVRYQILSAVSGIGHDLPNATSSHVSAEGNAPFTGGEGHTVGCGHVLQEGIWDIYERVVEIL